MTDKILTPEQCRALDKRAIEELGIPSTKLMRAAAEAIARAVISLRGRRKGAAVGIVCGKGNNGGDGYATAHVLAKRGIACDVLSVFPEKQLSPDAGYFLKKIRGSRGIRLIDAGTLPLLKSAMAGLAKNSVVVDAMLGTGFRGKPKGLIAHAIDLMNTHAKRVVAADVPSGLDASDGSAPKAVRADITVAMGCCKTGLLLGSAMDHVGTLRVADIGIPAKLSDALHAPRLLQETGVGSLLPRRKRVSHKGTYGHLLIVAGSRGMTGAAILAARAALRSGVGLVSVACPDGTQETIAQGCPEAMTLPLPQTPQIALGRPALKPLLQAMAKRFTAMLLGPGLGRSPQTQDFARQCILQIPLPVVIDADGLFAVAAKGMALRKAKSKRIVLTPHLGEFARLLRGKAVAENPAQSLKDYASSQGCVVLLKSHISRICDGRSMFIGVEGNPGMATAGMGDVLSGIVGALLAQGLSGLDAACAASFVHGRAGDAILAKKGTYGLMASDVVEAIPSVIRRLPLRR